MPNSKKDTPNEEAVETMENNSSQNQPTALINYLFFAAVAILFSGILLSGANLNANELPVFAQICAIISLLLISTCGVIIVIRKEAPRPGLSNIKGIGAILTGLLVAISSGGIGIVLTIDLLKRLLEK